MKIALALFASFTVIATLAVQHRTILRVSSDLAALRQERDGVSVAPAAGAEDPSSRRAIRAVSGDAALQRRLAALEQSVAQLARASDYLMERGQLPLATNKVDDLARRFLDTTAADRERLRVLGLLRRNGGMTEEVLQQTLSWLKSSTNAGTRRELVQQLDGATNSAVKATLLGLMGTEASGNVREEIAQSLRRHTDDPSVESTLWNAALNDSDGDVRDEAREALREGPAGEARLAALRARATNPQATLDEQLLALEALRNSRASISDIIANMAQFAQNTQDSSQRTRLFEAFDEVDDPSTKLPLVYGLQDPNPLVREQAADALSRHAADPAVREWLQHIASNDADPRVRREAFQALQERRR